MTSALYERLIERDLDGIAPAARAFETPDDLFLAVARFAVLAYAPSQHAKRAVMCCRAAYELRGCMGERWTDLVVACARYTAESRQPWSEPPVLEPPEPSEEDLRDAIAGGDRLRAERWLAAHLGDATLGRDLRAAARGDALLMTATTFALLPLLGDKGKFALLRMPLWEMVTAPDAPPDEDAPLATLVGRAIETKGAIDAVQAVFVYDARHPSSASNAIPEPPVYQLARDYGQTLIAHAVARRRKLPQAFLDAVLHNLEHGESYADWSFA